MNRIATILGCAVVVAGMSGSLSADDEAGFRNLFDGKTLKGWQGEQEYWRVEEGVIIGESTADRPLKHNTFLVWEQGLVDDFELRLRFRISGSDSANSGIQFRGTLRDDGHVVGYQADIDRAGKWIGALYDEAARGSLAGRGQKTVIDSKGEKEASQVADADELFKQVQLDDWNDYSITARGNQITLKINGHVTAEVIDHDPSGLDLQGLLALQLHSGPPMKIEFKDVRLKRFPLTDGRKKIVFIAGTRSHGYFSHEHNAGCLLLAKGLDRAAEEEGLPVLTAVYKNGWPADPTALDNADTVVSYCDGGGRHYLNDRLEDFDHLVETRGVGLVCIHYAVETTIGEPGNHFLKWIGGYFEPHWSVNPHWTASFDELPEHPITRGVEPFEINDEWYYHMRFQHEMQGVTPILTDMPPRETLNRKDGAHSGNPHVRAAVLERKEPQHVAWAYERPNGKGRGFGFTGGHFHKNWADDDFRTIVLNAIVWSAGLDVPTSGVPSATPTQEELEANQDYPPPSKGKTQASSSSEKKTVAEAAGGTSSKPVFSSPVVTTSTPGHAVAIDAPIKGAESLYLVVTDGRNGYSCDWADWAQPVLVTGSGDDAKTARLTEMKWKSAVSDWGGVRVNQNAGGGSLRIAGQPVEFGIGTHANSVIKFELPKGHTFERFLAVGGLDNGGTDQAGGGGTSVQFHVFTAEPAASWLAKMSSAGSATATLSHEAGDALEQLDIHEDLVAELFASEPMMTNPAAIDIDHQGRVWVCEAVNYRAFRNKDVIGDRDAGDRLLILEDTDGDARADTVRVFYEGHDVDSAHGILILPSTDGKTTRALVSALDQVFYLIDENGDLKADRKEILFTGISGSQHDHGIHAFHFGPDGKLYFNFGNEGKQLCDADGKPVVDRAGREVNDRREPYQQGMVFRCNLDGSDVETLGWNFRNNWEMCVDSFGTIWQSDNDDDGNRGVRINYVMEYGNYGYRDELTGAGWREPRTGWEAEIPHRHWHLNDPGVMPNMLQTGAGAPTGICLYEGDLLPAEFYGQPVHTDAGPNICRAYRTYPDGAGYRAEIINILDGSRNKWFRPSDVCVAPDGSLLVADWYDPGVGGHRMQDVERGRLFRVRPQGKAEKYVAPPVDVSNVDGAVAALLSPNMSVRYLGWQALMGMGPQAEAALANVWETGSARHRARALWALGKLDLPREKTLAYLEQAMTDEDPNLRITGIRLARQLRDDFEIGELRRGLSLDDPSPAVRREMLIGLSEVDFPEAPRAWAELAIQHDGSDRWYLEALGIAARGRWDEFLAAWMEHPAQQPLSTKAARDIVWRSRGTRTAGLLRQIVMDPETPETEIPRLIRSFDFVPKHGVGEVMMDLAFSDFGGNEERAAFVNAEALNRLEGFDIDSRPMYRDALARVLDATEGTVQFVRLVDKFSVADRYGQLLEKVLENPESQFAVEGVKTLFAKQQHKLIRQTLKSDELPVVTAMVDALATAQDGRGVALLKDVANDQSRQLSVRRSAIKGLGAIRQGAVSLKELAESGSYDPALKDVLAATLHTVQWKDLKEYAAKAFPLPPGKDSKPLPPIAELASRQGDAVQGRIIFNTNGTCNKCHVVNGIGKEVGPNLSEIGKKLSREALYESILYPSAAISHNYENWLIITIEGQILTGLLVSETDTSLRIKDEKGILREIPIVAVEERRKQSVSLMPADLQKVMSTDELVDVVEYLTTLKAAKKE